ncbi:DUF3978 family protein [Bacillus sp. NPDC094106]|uniref:DUF3978 family protein n=1 Tax=Bacillus sp. NPDC094106 TaxID=3363949 RepID=UPI0037F755AE
MEVYHMHSFMNKEMETKQDEIIFSLHICEENEFDASLTKSTTLSFTITPTNIKITTKKWTNYSPGSMIGKNYIIPTQAFNYLLPIICENEEEIIIQMDCFGTHGELLLKEKLFILKNNDTKITTFFENLNENINQALRLFQNQYM